MPKKASEARLYRAEMDARVLSSGQPLFDRIFSLGVSAFQEGAISVKNKELMGLVGSMVLRCDDCIFDHLDRCVTAGCSRQEIYEALQIAMVVGGSVVTPHLRHAFEILEELGAVVPNAVPFSTPPSELPTE